MLNYSIYKHVLCLLFIICNLESDAKIQGITSHNKDLFSYFDLEIHNQAQIMLVHRNTGQYQKISLFSEREHLFNNIRIQLYYCFNNNSNFPTHIAYLSIHQKGFKTSQGWLFSRETSLSFPQLTDYFILLLSC